MSAGSPGRGSGDAPRPGDTTAAPAVAVRYPPPTSKNWAVLEWSDIPSKERPGLVYLRRLRLVQTPWASVYVHWIYEPDTDRHPHDHPWTFGSLILRGGYTEHVYRGTPEDWGWRVRKVWPCWSWHVMPIEHAHRITVAEPGLVTLVVTGPRRRGWGFWTQQGFVPWREYVGSLGVSPPPDEFA